MKNLLHLFITCCMWN